MKPTYYPFQNQCSAQFKNRRILLTDQENFMKRTLTVLLIILLSLAADSFAATADLVFKSKEGRIIEKRTVQTTLQTAGQKEYELLTVAKNSVPPETYDLEVRYSRASAQAGEAGFFLTPTGMYGLFKSGKDAKFYASDQISMALFGMKTPRAAFTAIVTGMRNEFCFAVTRKDNRYCAFPIFKLDGDVPHDDIVIRYYPMDPQTATYTQMARIYQQYQIKHEKIIPIRERVKNSPELAYAADSIEVRIRHGWKPCPPKVLIQNDQNEPPMKVVVSFDRVKDIVNEFKRQGIDRAELCLVGWHRGGHDGRFPQIFPPDDQLGGEQKLREAVQKAQKEGFQIVCHTCSTDSYEVADCWDPSDTIKNKDGKYKQFGSLSGGRRFNLCMRQAYEKFVKSDYPKLADFGFRGLHYNDVVTIVRPRKCYDPHHFCTADDAAAYIGKMLDMARSVFGGSASEGGHDFAVSHLDYALYTSMENIEVKLPPLVERHVPLWQLVYHGYVLSNPLSITTNYTIKSPFTRLKMYEYGGRPMFYIHSIFKDVGGTWMGSVDLRVDSNDDLQRTTAKIKEGYDEFQKLKPLQYEFMTSHEKIADNVFKSVFSDGTAIVCNYGQTDYHYRNSIVKALDYSVFKER